MHRRYTLAHLILAVVVALGLTPLMVVVDAQAQIAFASDRDGNYDIYVMDADGRNQRRLTNNRHDDWDPSWSPDGKRIAFTSSEDRGNVEGGDRQIYVIDVNGKNLRRLSNNPFAEWEPSWSPDGKRIAFVSRAGWGHWRIYVMDADGKNLRRLTKNDHSDENPSWSPDGERIAFTSDRDGNPEIYVMDLDGGNQRRLTRNASPNTNPSWSPDGKRIVFVSTRHGNPEIYVMNADGVRRVQRLTKDHSDDVDPTWFDPTFAVEIAPAAVAPASKKRTMWVGLKQIDK